MNDEEIKWLTYDERGDFLQEKGAIALEDCTERHVYEIASRNLAIGVFNGENGFIGIRQKFDYRYLFTEYHWDTGPPFGTVTPLRDLGMILSGEYPLLERYPQVRCVYCGEFVAHFPYEEEERRGEWRHTTSPNERDWGSREPPELDCKKVSPVSGGVYDPLFSDLDRLEEDRLNYLAEVDTDEWIRMPIDYCKGRWERDEDGGWILVHTFNTGCPVHHKNPPQ